MQQESQKFLNLATHDMQLVTSLRTVITFFWETFMLFAEGWRSVFSYLVWKLNKCKQRQSDYLKVWRDILGAEKLTFAGFFCLSQGLFYACCKLYSKVLNLILKVTHSFKIIFGIYFKNSLHPVRSIFKVNFSKDLKNKVCCWFS